MATRVWQSSDGDWSNTASWTGATVPISNDVAVFPDNNSVSVTSGLSQAAVDLDALIVHPGYTGDIATSGSHLTISADRVLHEGSGTLYYTDGNGITDLFILNASGGAAVVSGTSLTRVLAMRGQLTLDASMSSLTDLEVSFFNSRASDALVTIENGAGTITNLRMNGGTVVSSAVITNLYMQGGTLTQENPAGAITNINQLGGRVIYKSASTIALAQIMAGILDCGQDARALTITLLRLWPGASAIIPEDIVTVTAGGKLLERSTVGDPV